MQDNKPQGTSENTAEAAQETRQQPIDQRIKQAQRKGVGVYFLSGSVTVLVLLGFLLWLFFVKGFNLIVTPSDAAVNAQIKLESGLAWVGESNIYTLGGEISVSVASPTFQTAAVTINSQSPSTIEIQLLPTPATISATAVSDDDTYGQWQSLTQWFLNGKLIHVGAELVYKTMPGKYQLNVTHPYYENASESLQLERAQEVSLRPSLQQINGSISLNSAPQGIQVTKNDQVMGVTPLTIQVNGGEHKIQLSSNEFETVTEVIPVSVSFLHPKRNYQLAPKPGLLNISAQPANGLLLINGVESALGEVRLAANRQHKLEYRKSGFSQFIKTISVNPDAPLVLDIKLEAQFGELTLTTNIPALISVDGKKVSSRLVQITEQRLAAIPHVIEISAQGYRTVKRTVSIKPNQQTSLNINLLTEFDARRQQGLPLYIEQLGINMQRFRADAFTMGSPDNETGRRRNEHQIEVDFSRQFWVSETEITQSQFAASLGQAASSKSKSTLPITGISWMQAAEYCNWLSIQEGLPIFYRFVNGRYAGVNRESRGYRLPTEAEWEWLAKKAKRANSTVYVWGNQDKLREKIGNFADMTLSGKQLIYFAEYEDGKTGAAEVASFDADRTGLYDLAGNVSEWVHDRYTNSLPDTGKQQIDYLGSAIGDSWVIKGGNFESGRLRGLRGAFREFSSAGKETIGFRIARYHD